jgi:hypothetical protein
MGLDSLGGSGGSPRSSPSRWPFQPLGGLLTCLRRRVPTGQGASVAPGSSRPHSISHPRSTPGETTWLRRGTYQGAFTSNLTGNSSAPIILRQYSGERAIIDGNGGALIHLWSRAPGRTSGPSRFPTPTRAATPVCATPTYMLPTPSSSTWSYNRHQEPD